MWKCMQLFALRVAVIYPAMLEATARASACLRNSLVSAASSGLASRIGSELDSLDPLYTFALKRL